MNIIIGEKNAEEARDKYTVLELDTFSTDDGGTVTAYCLLELDAMEDLFTLQQFRDLHQNLMKNYRLKNWNFCEQALEHLRGRWRGEVDSFYDDLASRVTALRLQPPGEDWDGTMHKSMSTPLAPTML